MSENIDPKAKQEFLTMIGHSLEIIELEAISNLMDQRDAANARAEAAENVINAARAVLARQVAEPHTSRGDTNAMVEAITILETVTLKGGEG